MKFLCLSLALLAAACVVAKPHHHKNHEAMRANAEMCATEGGMTMEEGKSAMKAMWHGDATTEDQKCFGLCMMKKSGAVTEDGKMQKPPGMDGGKDLTDAEKETMSNCLPASVTSCNDAATVMSCVKALKDARHKNKEQ